MRHFSLVSARVADVDWFRAFIERAEWTFARTYVESYPHEWTHECRGVYPHSLYALLAGGAICRIMAPTIARGIQL